MFLNVSPLTWREWYSLAVFEEGCRADCVQAHFSQLPPGSSSLWFCVGFRFHFTRSEWQHLMRVPLGLCVFGGFLSLPGNILCDTETHNKYISKLHFKMSYCFKVNLKIEAFTVAEERWNEMGGGSNEIGHHGEQRSCRAPELSVSLHNSITLLNNPSQPFSWKPDFQARKPGHFVTYF